MVVTCVVFDIDDTLYLERDYVRSGFAHVGEWARRQLGLANFADLAWEAFEQGVRASTFDLVLRNEGVDPTPELVAKLVRVYRTHPPRIELAPDARACLRDLHGRVALATVSDGPLESQRAKAGALGLGRWIDQIVFTDELGAGFGKPDRRAFDLVQGRLGRPGGECVYVADNPAKDFSGPRSLGWGTVRVRRPESLHHAVESGSHVDVEVQDLTAAATLFEGLSARDGRLRQGP
jgi:putative hydrolase of the HAD superfamily